jgi:hypothetical protein
MQNQESILQLDRRRSFRVPYPEKVAAEAKRVALGWFQLTILTTLIFFFFI